MAYCARKLDIPSEIDQRLFPARQFCLFNAVRQTDDGQHHKTSICCGNCGYHPYLRNQDDWNISKRILMSVKIARFFLLRRLNASVNPLTLSIFSQQTTRLFVAVAAFPPLTVYGDVPHPELFRVFDQNTPDKLLRPWLRVRDRRPLGAYAWNSRP